MVLIVALVIFYVTSHNFAVDFSHWYWPAGDRLLHGRSLYLRPYPGALYYPPLAGLLFGPFALLPAGIASGLFTSLVLLAIPLTLRLLDVRDWRVYGLVMLWHPIILGWQTANLSLLLALGVAVAWRLRDKPMLTGLAVGVLVSLKLFLWPLGLFFLATRRYVALGWAAASAAALTALSFAVVGFSELPHYSRALQSFLGHTEPHSYSLTSLVLNLGAGGATRYVITVAAAAAVAVLAVVVGRRGHDRAALVAFLVTCLLASPIVEAHYLVLLIVPLALVRPRLDAAWAIPMALWLTPVDGPANWQRMLTLSVLAAGLAYALVNDGPRAARIPTAT